MGDAGGQTAPPAPLPDKWGAHLDLEGKLGNNRDLGEADVFLPVWQDGTSLVFGNIKARLDDNASREGNFGLGLRHMLESGWNLGTYGYYDRRRTETHNWFSQATFGVEALSLDWDLRANWYAPLGRRTHDLGSSGGGGASTAALSGTTVTITTPGASLREERSLTGFDAEIGWRVPVFSAEGGTNLRLYGGGYRFYADDVNPVQGPRGRVELTFDEVPGLWSGSRLALGGEVQHDGPRGTTGFATARLRIPLQVFGQSAARLTPIEKRMADPVVRDIDIVAQSRLVSTPSTTETATALGGGGTLVVLDSGSTTGANLPTAISNAGNNSTVLLSGSFVTSAAISPATGQTIRGGGTITVQSASGKTATLTTANATIDRTAGQNTFAVGNNNVTLTGLTIANTVAGIGGTAVTIGATNITISNSTLTATSSTNDTFTLVVQAGSSATITGNTVTASGPAAGHAWALRVEGTATVSNNSLGASNSATSIYTYLSGANIAAGSTGNTQTGGVCNVNVGGGGSTIGFTNAANCGP